MSLGSSLIRPLRLRDLIEQTIKRKWWSSKGGSLTRRVQTQQVVAPSTVAHGHSPGPDP